MSRRCFKDSIKLKFYIDLGIIFVTVYIDLVYYELAYSQILRSRYGQALNKQPHKKSNVDLIYHFEWDVEHRKDGWLVTVNKTNAYFINDLSMLGVHYANQKDEISDCFEKVLFSNYIGYHASMVANNNGDVIMIGGAVGSGKTTLTKAFVDVGYNYVSDDLALINDKLVCQYFRTSFHIRTRQGTDTHEINNEHRKFELVSEQPLLSCDLNLKGIIILKSFLETNNEIRIVSNIYDKFRSINSLIIGFPYSDFVFTTSKRILSLPVYEIRLSRNENPNETARDIGDLIWHKSM